jgi:CheY-like chemotaxis protein
MRVVVVDDMLSSETEVAAALGDTGASDGPYQVGGARSPADLEVLLRTDRFDLAFVDINYGKRVRESGLTALRVLAEHDTPAVVYWSSPEDNRALFVLAAFQFFRPLALVPKTMSRAEIRSVVDTLAAGQPCETPDAARYRPASQGPSLLDRLVPTSGDLTIWRALTVFAGRQEVAREAHFSPRRVDNFLRDRFDAMVDVQRLLLDDPADGLPALGSVLAETRQNRLAPMHAFAQTHQAFFRDPELASQFRERERKRERR